MLACCQARALFSPRPRKEQRTIVREQKVTFTVCIPAKTHASAQIDSLAVWMFHSRKHNIIPMQFPFTSEGRYW
ncbi:hypothetical protein NPIL_215181 [Nephila pilipes]|uniref:Uncharacterized protein n=1 Tax=Nephila pilipes TaxID=299642 RepID=A0A8X6P0G5_NEPPI|nr:hypothetical protein NPIL_215181 [Nephila pilipes]